MTVSNLSSNQRQLTKEEIEEYINPLLELIKTRNNILSDGDRELEFALNRKLYKELSYLERGKPSQRAKLRKLKFDEQSGLCRTCKVILPNDGKFSVLDRLYAINGYTPNNVRLICQDCDSRIQHERNYK